MVVAMQSGRETLGQIETGLGAIKAEEDRLNAELAEATRRQGSLVAERLEAVKALAAMRVRDAISDGIVNEADNLTSQVATILAARMRTIADLSARHETAQADRARLVTAHAAIGERIGELERRLDQLAVEARKSLGSDPAWRALAEARDELASTAGRAAAKSEEAKRTEAQKGAAYRGDPLFMYLWERGYGTGGYGASGLVAMLDGWVAGLVRYPTARTDFAVLTEIPIRLEAHARALAERAEQARSKVEAMEAARITELAGSDLMGALGKLRAEQGVLVQRLQAADAEIGEAGVQLKAYAEGQDQSFQRAVALHAEFVDKEHPRKLLADALATRTGEDDRLVARTRDLARDLDQAAELIAARRRDLDRLFRRREELARVAATFRRQRYEDEGSVFSNNPALGDLLRQVLAGAITAAEYWARAKSQQRWQSRPADSWRRSSGLPPFDGWSGGSGPSWPLPGPSSGPSSSSDDDFQTGGQF